MTRDDQLALIADANRAPSVHNIQPARFRFEGGAIVVLEDTRRRLLIGDPEGKDNQKSLGAAAEGLVLALSERGSAALVEMMPPKQETVREIARVRVGGAAAPDPLASYAATRASYRGAFAKPSAADRAALSGVREACLDLHIIEAPEEIAHVARVFDDASMEVLRDEQYRRELVSWMRLRPSHPSYQRDGLSAPHMALSSFEAFGAGIVMGGAFPVLDRFGIAAPLIAEGGKVKSAAGVALFHRPATEPEFETGRRFYRVWLEIERQGLALCPMSVLADLPHVAAALLKEAGLGADRKLVTAFRIGQRPNGYQSPPRVRLPPAELLV